MANWQQKPSKISTALFDDTAAKYEQNLHNINDKLVQKSSKLCVTLSNDKLTAKIEQNLRCH